MNFLADALFCASVSMDAFTIGCSYGLRNFRSSLYTNVIITFVVTLFSATATLCGKIIVQFIPQCVSTYLGVGFLLILGIYTIINGIIKPQEATNCKKKISIKESFCLSFAVSIDAFSGTLAYTMSGHTAMWIPVLVGIFHSLFFSIGIVISRKTVYCFNLPQKALTTISGAIIIAVALSRIVL